MDEQQRSMTKQFIYQYALSLIILFALIYCWEFFGEEYWSTFLGAAEESLESTSEHWEYVFTVSVFGGLALIVPTMVSIFHANKYLRAEQKHALLQHEKEHALHEEQLKLMQACKELEIQQERLQLFKATMRTVHDIVGNFLNSLQFFMLEAEQKNMLSLDARHEIEALIRVTSARLEELSALDTPVEKEVGAGMTIIDYNLTTQHGDTTTDDAA